MIGCARNIFLSVLVSLSLQNVIWASQCEVDGFNVYKVGGLTLSNEHGPELEILAQNRFKKYSINAGEKEIVRQLTVMIKGRNPNPRGSQSPKELAQKIYDVSKAFGIDPIIYGAKI